MGYKKREFQKELEKYLKDPDNGPRLLSLSNSAQGDVSGNRGIEKPGTDTALLIPGLAGYAEPVTAIGNSLVAGTNTFQGLSFLQQLDRRAPEIFLAVSNRGVGGQSSAAVLANLLANGVPAGTRRVLYHEGSNDAGSATPVSVAAHIGNIAAMHQWCSARRIAFDIIASAPVEIVDTWTLASVQRTEQFAFAERIYAQRNGLVYIDPWSPLCDTDGTLNAAAGAAGTVHPDQSGHDAAAIETIRQYRTGRPPLLPRSNGGPAGIFPTFGNVLNLNGAGLPTAWSQNGTAPTACAPSAASLPVRGNWSDSTITGLTTSGDFYRYLHSGGQFAAGDIVKVSGYFKFTNTSNMRLAARLSLIRSVAPNSSLYLFDTTASFGETYFEAEIVVPSDLTQATLWISYKPINAGAYSGSFSFACLDCYNVTKNTF